MRRRYSRLLYIAVLAGAAVAIGSGVALGVVGADGSINGCYKAENGQLRVIDATGACNRAELPISWNQTGPQGPAGPAGPEGPKGDQGPPGETVRGYRVSRLTPSEVEVTAVGGGPIGFTFPAGSGPTQILTMTLPKGVYAVNSSVAARKDFGTGDFICWVHNNVTAQNVTRTALGAEAGHARRATVASNGIFGIPTGGGTLTLECWQARNGSGEPTGESPTAFYNTLTATTLTGATLTRFPSGSTTELP